MVESTLSRLAEVFSQVTDPRNARGGRHPFQGMVALLFVEPRADGEMRACDWL